MKSFVHIIKSKNFVINTLFVGKPVKFIDEVCSDGIKLAVFVNQSSWCTLDILKFFCNLWLILLTSYCNSQGAMSPICHHFCGIFYICKQSMSPTNIHKVIIGRFQYTSYLRCHCHSTINSQCEEISFFTLFVSFFDTYACVQTVHTAVAARL